MAPLGETHCTYFFIVIVDSLPDAFYISSHADADPEFFFKIKLDEEAKGLTNRPLTLTVRVNQPGAKVKWTYKGKDLDVSHDIIIL